MTDPGPLSMRLFGLSTPIEEPPSGLARRPAARNWAKGRCRDLPSVAYTVITANICLVLSPYANSYSLRGGSVTLRPIQMHVGIGVIAHRSLTPFVASV